MTPLLPLWGVTVLWLASLGLLVYTALTYSWQVLHQNRPAQHIFFASTLVLVLFWQSSAGILPGLEFHILALTALTLLMGWRLALLAAALMQAVQVLLGSYEWSGFGYHFLLESALPIAFTWQFYSLVYLRLPHNPFVYILVAGFLNAGFTHAFLDIVESLAYVLSGTYSLDTVWHDYLRYLPLMMFPEGVVNGMFIAGMVAFHTEWLSTFNEDSYFN